MTKQLTKRHKRIAALAGIVLGLLCHALPPEYQGPCRAILHVCGL